MINGETGTGKEGYWPAALHDLSPRATCPSRHQLRGHSNNLLESNCFGSMEKRRVHGGAQK